MSQGINDSETEKIFPCPVCRKITRYHAKNPFRPFCSERCRIVDLGQWLEEDYRVPGDPARPEPSDES